MKDIVKFCDRNWVICTQGGICGLKDGKVVVCTNLSIENTARFVRRGDEKVGIPAGYCMSWIEHGKMIHSLDELLVCHFEEFGVRKENEVKKAEVLEIGEAERV